MNKLLAFLSATLILLMMSLFVSCGHPQEDDAIVVSPDNEMEASDFIHHVEHIRLSKSDSCILSRIDALRLSDDKISILCNRQIFIFSNKGDFISKINRLGNGHGEYNNVNDFQLYKNRIYILSGLQKLLLEYTIDGNYVDKYNLDDKYQHFIIVDDNTIILSSEQNNDKLYNFVFYDLKKKKEICSIDKFDKNEAFTFSGFNGFLCSENELIVGHPFDYSIYSLKKDGADKRTIFDFNTEDHLPATKKGFYEMNEETKYKKCVRYLQTYAAVGTNQYIVYPLFGESGIKTCITRIDKEGNNRTIKVGEKIDNVYKYFFMGDYLTIKGNQIIMAADASKLLELEKENGFSYFADNGLNAEDNPILFFYEISGE